MSFREQRWKLIGPLEFFTTGDQQSVYEAKLDDGSAFGYDAIIDRGRSQRRPDNAKLVACLMPARLRDLKRS